MKMKIPVNRNTAEWDLPKEIADQVLSSIEEIECGAALRKTEFIEQADGSLICRVTESDGQIKEDVLSLAKSARMKTGLSQAKFSELLGISKRTLQDWEQGKRTPSGAAKTLLKVALKHPNVLDDIMV